MNPHFFTAPFYFTLVQGSGFKVQGSGLSWRLRRDLSTQVAAVLAFVISHMTFLAAQDDETGRCQKVCDGGFPSYRSLPL